MTMEELQHLRIEEETLIRKKMKRFEIVLNKNLIETIELSHKKYKSWKHSHHHKDTKKDKKKKNNK